MKRTGSGNNKTNLTFENNFPYRLPRDCTEIKWPEGMNSAQEKYTNGVL